MVGLVDLNATKSANDKKVYRHLTLSNGLECVCISNPNDRAETEDEEEEMQEYGSESGHSSASDSENGGEATHSDSSEETAEKTARARKQSAVAIAVPVGSYMDPRMCQGKLLPNL